MITGTVLRIGILPIGVVRRYGRKEENKTQERKHLGEE